MEIQKLQSRVYYLAGALEEAQRVYKEALGEIDAANKKQTDSKSDTVVTRTPITIPGKCETDLPQD